MQGQRAAAFTAAAVEKPRLAPSSLSADPAGSLFLALLRAFETPKPPSDFRSLSGYSEPDGREHTQLADLRRPALGTADRKPASQDVVLNVSNVEMNSSA